MSFVRRCLILSMVATIISMATVAMAQEARGRITGRVVDPSKAAVPGASVKVTDPARGTTVSLTTNSEGLFQANYLLPGTYQVTVEFAGFKKHVRENVQLQINETRDLPVVLEVGALEEIVAVTTESLTNTSDANMGLVIDTRRLADLPIVHGDPYKLMGTATGVSHTGDPRLDRPYEPTHIIGYAMDGTRGNRSDLLIDGSPSTATANANEVIATYVPQSDLVQEFKVQTATFDAQFGNTEGGVTSITIKAGTNKLHGTAYYFNEPEKLGANDFFGKAAGQERTKTNHSRPGFTLNGPLIKDRTFFTIGYEHITDGRPRWNANANSWSPTEALRNGDFSAYSSNVTIYDPRTRVSDGKGGFVGQPFPGNRIPADRISPVAKAFLNYYGLPENTSQLEGNMNDANAQELAEYDTGTIRFDQQVSSKNRMFVRGSYYKRDSTYNDYVNTGITMTNFQFISYQAVIDDVHIFNPTTVLNVRYGYNRFERNQGQIPKYINDFDLTQLGFPSGYSSIVGAQRFPRLNFPGGAMHGTGVTGELRPVTSQTVTTTLNKTMGRHAFKVGAEMRIYREDSQNNSNQVAGEYTFDNAYTRPSSVSSADYLGLQAFASFLLGLPSSTSILRASDYSEYSKTWGFFVHDDWKVNDKLTLNLGLRYEIETALTERQNKSVKDLDFAYVQPKEPNFQANYAANVADPALKALLPQVTMRGGLNFPTGDGPHRLYNVPKNTFLPRFGFAYQLNPKTVVRGGVGLFAGFLGERRGDVIVYGYNRTTTVLPTTNANGAPIPQEIGTALLNTNILPPVGAADGQQTMLGNSIAFFNQDPKVSKQLRYQIGFQRELPGQISLEAAFVGNYGYDIELSKDINALPSQFLNADNSRSAAMNANETFLATNLQDAAKKNYNPLAGFLPGSGLNGANISRRQMLRPYPHFGNITATNNDGKSWYSSLQVSLQKRFGKSTTFGLSYTRSHWTQQTEYLNATDPMPTKMVSDQDSPHRLSLTGIFELPGKGAVLGGWQVQGVYTFARGYPVGNFPDLFYLGNDPTNYSDIGLPASERSTLRWFNIDALANTNIINPATGKNFTATEAAPVSHVRTLPLRFDGVRNDNITNLDFSVIKNVTLRGEMKLQLRGELINALNQTYLLVPTTAANSANFGKITGANQRNYPRRAQLGVKLIF